MEITETNPEKTTKKSWANAIQKENFVKFLKDMGVECRKLFAWSDDENGEPQSFPEEWPLKINFPCTVCNEKFTSIPLFRIIKWNEKRNFPILVRHEFYCGLRCWKDALVKGSDLAKGPQLEALYKFATKYLDVELEEITCLPLSFRKDRNMYGFMEKEEFNEKSSRYYGFYVTPPMQAIDTFAFTVDRSVMTSENLGFKLNNIVTPERQKKYLENCQKATIAQQTASKEKKVADNKNKMKKARNAKLI